jgi:hypothetical protein
LVNPVSPYMCGGGAVKTIRVRSVRSSLPWDSLTVKRPISSGHERSGILIDAPGPVSTFPRAEAIQRKKRRMRHLKTCMTYKYKIPVYQTPTNRN